MKVKGEKGFTLVELLAVIVILGIIAAIAIVSIGGLIDRAKSDAFVQSAYTLKEAAEIYARDQHVHDNDILKVSYQILYQNNLLEEIKDPYTKTFLDPKSNDSYVIMNGLNADSVCLKGFEKNICSTNNGDTSVENPVPFDELSINWVHDN
ncbi:prepilin-type N-terminal cleavage/methylation domain-containing protein [Heyndrickxia acidicola]|uniref:Prepilin-type N-terminal cleavage/methylation domain-containing protein n=1 Tax=Heyndrickxia acidicola TaxID=209389 RepID=A0ABU6MJF1_9BACI|nr:prepilin-type N-terminal cleavage/methylation domain-containing protein [Heyndrickxia acidicola]MED1204796.1 prepilin-type N-terminal cleavage/methylation domain-containing protein [Heyndrickxia acidicola]